MKILLINNNPVVSRLTALSARKEDIEIDEIQEVTELSSDTYDIVFVDADSWTKDVRDVISENIKTQKSVLFYADGDEEEKSSFDLSILKPFLPSEVSAVIRSIEEKNEELDTTSTEEQHFNILDDTKVENRNELFDLEEVDVTEEKKEETLTLDENISFDDKLEEAFPLKINTLDDDLLDDKLSIEKSKEKETNELFDLDLSDELPSLEDDLFAEDKKEKTLELMDELELDDDILEVKSAEEEKSSLLSLDDELTLELDELAVEVPKKETQILDELEIENIKGILTEDSSEDMTLEDLMPAMAVVPTIDKKEETKIVEEEKEYKEENEQKEEASSTLDIDANVLSQTLAAMPVENLRLLLAGAKVSIKIKFPKLNK